MAKQKGFGLSCALASMGMAAGAAFVGVAFLLERLIIKDVGGKG